MDIQHNKIDFFSFTVSSYEVGVESKTSKDVSKMSAHSTVYGKPNFTNRNLVKKVSCPPLLTTSAAKEPNSKLPSGS